MNGTACVIRIVLLGSLISNAWASPNTMTFWHHRSYWDDSKTSEDGTVTLMGHTDSVTALDVSQDGKTILSASVDGTMRLWNAGYYHVRTIYFDEDSPVVSAVLLPDGVRAISGSADGMLRYFDGKGAPKSWAAHHGAVRVLARDRRGALIASGGDDGAIYLWSTADWSRRVLREGGSSVVSLGFDASAKRLVGVVNDGKAFVWDIESGNSRELHVKDATLGPAAFSPDDKHLAIAAGPGTIAILDGRTYGLIETAASPTAEIATLRYSDDGRFIATAGEVVTADLWNAQKLGVAGILSGHRARVKAVAFMPDGRSLITGGADRDIRIFFLGGYRRVSRAETKEVYPAVVDVDEPYAETVSTDTRILAVVIGVERYSVGSVPRADFAANDAASFARFLRNRWGVSDENLLLLTDADATDAALKKALGPWLRNRAASADRVVVFFSGHGAPDVETGDSYLVPYDGDPNYVRDTAIRLSDVYRGLADLPVRDVRVILDACFSGRGSRSLIAKGVRPLVTVKEDGDAIGRNTVVLAATGPNQVGTSYEAKRHGMMTYYVLKGLRGAADGDNDGEISTLELFGYLKKTVESEARRSNVRQSPEIMPAEAETDQRRKLAWQGRMKAQ